MIYFAKYSGVTVSWSLLVVCNNLIIQHWDCCVSIRDSELYCRTSFQGKAIKFIMWIKPYTCLL